MQDILEKTPELSLKSPWEVGQMKKGNNNYIAIKEHYEVRHGNVHWLFGWNMNFKKSGSGRDFRLKWSAETRLQSTILIVNL